MFKKTITINDVMNTLTEERETMLSKYKNILENQSDPVNDPVIFFECIGGFLKVTEFEI
jgi:hypothetical protein